MEVGHVVRAAVGKVRAVEIGRRADSDQQLVDDRQVHHLFDGDASERLLPTSDRLSGPGRESGSRAGLQTEGGEEIAATEAVLKLGRLVEQEDQFFPQRNSRILHAGPPAERRGARRRFSGGGWRLRLRLVAWVAEVPVRQRGASHAGRLRTVADGGATV